MCKKHIKISYFCKKHLFFITYYKPLGVNLHSMLLYYPKLIALTLQSIFTQFNARIW